MKRYVQFISTCKVAASGWVRRLLYAWHVSSEWTSRRPNSEILSSLRTWVDPPLGNATLTLLTKTSFLYHATVGSGFPEITINFN